MHSFTRGKNKKRIAPSPPFVIAEARGSGEFIREDTNPSLDEGEEKSRKKWKGEGMVIDRRKSSDSVKLLTACLQMLDPTAMGKPSVESSRRSAESTRPIITGRIRRQSSQLFQRSRRGLNPSPQTFQKLRTSVYESPLDAEKNPGIEPGPIPNPRDAPIMSMKMELKLPWHLRNAVTIPIALSFGFLICILVLIIMLVQMRAIHPLTQQGSYSTITSFVTETVTKLAADVITTAEKLATRMQDIQKATATTGLWASVTRVNPAGRAIEIGLQHLQSRSSATQHRSSAMWITTGALMMFGFLLKRLQV